MCGRKQFYTFKVEGTASTEGSISTYQPGGVCIFVRGDIVGRINNTDSDTRGVGRWSYITVN
eukprot:10145256-Ditylum_brightwellii.AAC.1